jgi:ribosomal protein S18 acetylase RimI-like enzyme
MEIRKLNFASLQKLQEVLDLQQKAYAVEANVLGVQFLPPQQESLRDLQNTHEEIFAMLDCNQYVGALFLEKMDDGLSINKLFVDPNYFRKGIGSKLVEYVVKLYPTQKFRVSTGEANKPALRLYDEFDFSLIDTKDLGEGLKLVTLERTPKT